MHDHAISKHVDAFLIEDPTWKQVECVLMAIGHHCVPGVSPTVEAGADVIVLGEDVDELAFAFVAPLGSENDAESGVEACLARDLL